jgi:hypothetical protein
LIILDPTGLQMAQASKLRVATGQQSGSRSAEGREDILRAQARFQPFDPVARGGVSMAVAQIDGTTPDNLISAQWGFNVILRSNNS